MRNDFSTKDGRFFLFAGLVVVNFMVNIQVCYSWVGSFDVGTLILCKCVAR